MIQQVGDEDLNWPNAILEEETSTATVVAPGLHRKVSAFDAHQEDWIEYVECLELYFMANDITDAAKTESDSAQCRWSSNLSTG